MKVFQKNLNWISVGYLLVGLALILWPSFLLQAVCYAVGILVLIAGLSSIFSYLKTREELFSARFTLVLGLVVSALGLFLLLQPKTVAGILPLIVGLFVLFDGLGRLQTAWGLKKAGYERWWGLALPSLLSAILGAVVVFNPFGTAALMVQVVGVILLVEGLINISTGVLAKNVFEKLEKEMEEEQEEFEEFVADQDHTFHTNQKKSIDVEWKEL